MTRQNLIQDLLKHSQMLQQHINALNENMTEENTPLIEEIVHIVTTRTSIIDQLKELENEPKWTKEELPIIIQLKEIEGKLSPTLNQFFSTLSTEIKRLQQGKLAFNKYQKSSVPVRTDGAFFDKRR